MYIKMIIFNLFIWQYTCVIMLISHSKLTQGYRRCPFEKFLQFFFLLSIYFFLFYAFEIY